MTRESDELAGLRAGVDRMLDELTALDRAVSGTVALRAAVIDQLHTLTDAIRAIEKPGPRFGDELDRRAFRAEIATALRIPERTAETMVAHARDMVRGVPKVWHALARGDLTERTSRMLLDETAGLDAETRDAVIAAALELAPGLTAAQFEGRVRRLVEARTPDPVERHREARDRRGVWVTPQPDGMAYLEALLPAATALAAHDRLSAIARRLAEDHDETRTRDQLRADALGDLLIDGEIEAARGIRAEVAIMVPALRLLGRGGPSAELQGYGPIDDDTSRELCGTATGFVRILTHPETGATLSVGRERYRPPEELRRWVRTRDATCRFPGCRSSSRTAEIDHVLPWHRGGTTAATNLASLCIGHHKLKDGDTGWRVVPHDDGRLTWTSPADRVYETSPAISPPVALSASDPAPF